MTYKTPSQMQKRENVKLATFLLRRLNSNPNQHLFLDLYICEIILPNGCSVVI